MPAIPATPTEPDGDEICVPVKSLAMPDESEQMQAPEVGDAVSFTVDGKVTRIEGDQAYVKPESVNGEALPPPQAEPTMADDRAALDAQAAQLDAQGGGL